MYNLYLLKDYNAIISHVEQKRLFAIQFYNNLKIINFSKKIKGDYYTQNMK